MVVVVEAVAVEVGGSGRDTHRSGPSGRAVSRAPVRPGPRTGAAKMRNGAASTAYVTLREGGGGTVRDGSERRGRARRLETALTLRKKSVTLNMNVFCPTPRRK